MSEEEIIEKRNHRRYIIDNDKSYCLLKDCFQISQQKVKAKIIDLSHNGMAISTPEELDQELYEIHLVESSPIIASLAYRFQLSTSDIRYGFLFDQWIDSTLIEALKIKKRSL